MFGIWRFWPVPATQTCSAHTAPAHWAREALGAEPWGRTLCSGRQRSAQPSALVSRQQPDWNSQASKTHWGWQKPLGPGLPSFLFTVAGAPGHRTNTWLHLEMTRDRTLGCGNAPGQTPQRMSLPAQPWVFQAIGIIIVTMSIIIANICCPVCARQCSKRFTGINLFIPHENTMT